ncbi:MAG: hypothetical protein BGO07_03485 [Alphaproteobacteria bacterium 40-19]|nr:MAG: hypothetical protein BGO07_03485 [Alphaproteobacteria bacterium 40-19]
MQNKNIFWVLALLLSSDSLKAESETKTPLNTEVKEEQKKPKNKRNKKRGRGRRQSNKKRNETGLCEMIKDPSMVDKVVKHKPSALKLDSESLKSILQQAISGSQEAKNTAWKSLLTKNNFQPNEEQLASFLQNLNSEAQDLKKRTYDLEKQASFRFFVDQIASVPEITLKDNNVRSSSHKKTAREAAYAVIRMNIQKANQKYKDNNFFGKLFNFLNSRSSVDPEVLQKTGTSLKNLEDSKFGLGMRLKDLDQKISSIKTGTFSAAKIPLLEAKVVEVESALQAVKTILANVSELLGRADSPLWKKNLELWDSAFIPEPSQQKQEPSKVSPKKNISDQRLFNLKESRIKPQKNNDESFLDENPFENFFNTVN